MYKRLERILQLAIEKATKNGYFRASADYTWSEEDIEFQEYYSVIFSHDFAKSFFGRKPMCSACERHHETFSDCDCGSGNDMEEWEVRLRQQVISENPIKYLEQFLTE